MLLTRMSFSGGKETSHYIVYILDENFLCSDRIQRVRILNEAREIIKNLPLEGEFNTLFLYLKNASYSLLNNEEL
jgi:hypothetical protein